MGTIYNMKTRAGNAAANQFINTDATINGVHGELFQSYRSNIALKPSDGSTPILDANYWDYSATTGQYRNDFLGEGIAATRDKIAQGAYLLRDLNS